MKVLQLCNKPPFPAVDGGCIAIKNISLGLLKADIKLSLLCVSTTKHPFVTKEFPLSFIKTTKAKGVFVDTRINVIDAFSALVTSDSYNVSRYFSPDFDAELKRLLQVSKFDIVHLESLFMTPYLSTIRKYSKAKVVLRSHNLEHLIWERLANVEKKSAKRVYLKHLSSKLKQYEKQVLNEVDGIAAISFDDQKRYQSLDCNIPLFTIPFGIDLDKYKMSSKVMNTNISFCHIGSMNWAPNIEGVNWFLDDILPLVTNKEIQIHLAGREMPSYLMNLNDNRVVVHGPVENANTFINNHDIMVVPLLSGSGMRIKIIEGMALGKTVITTAVGAEGIDAIHNKNIIIANSPLEFANAIDNLVNHPEIIKLIGQNARNLVEEKYDNQEIVQSLLNFYESL
ncbi:MAG: glycosyltransferase family 4 protein [Crocinitomicaceae bacterium]